MTCGQLCSGFDREGDLRVRRGVRVTQDGACARAERARRRCSLLSSLAPSITIGKSMASVAMVLSARSSSARARASAGRTIERGSFDGDWQRVDRVDHRCARVSGESASRVYAVLSTANASPAARAASSDRPAVDSSDARDREDAGGRADARARRHFVVTVEDHSEHGSYGALSFRGRKATPSPT